VIEALAGEPSGCATIAHLASRTGLPRSTLYRVVDALLRLGWLERHARTKELQIGGRFAAAAHDSFNSRLLRAAAIDIELLARRLGQALYLDVRSGLDVLCLARHQGGSGVEIDRGTVGMRAPFGMTPASMAMLICLPEADAAEVLKANHRRYGEIAGFDRAGYLLSYARSRRAGTVRFDAIVLDRRMCGLGAAIRGPSGEAHAGIGMTYPRTHLTAASRVRAERLLASAAERIAGRLWCASNSRAQT
jgi:DNA-binding IclR family transcriptional regulator